MRKIQVSPTELAEMSRYMGGVHRDVAAAVKSSSHISASGVPKIDDALTSLCSRCERDYTAASNAAGFVSTALLAASHSYRARDAAVEKANKKQHFHVHDPYANPNGGWTTQP